MFSRPKFSLLALPIACSLVACEAEVPPRSVTEFVENPIMLEAAVVRCSQDRAKTRYDAECVNARQAVTQIEAKEEAKRKAEFEARSDSKRQALRRTQAAAAQARRRAAEAERLRQEAQYLAQFGVAPPTTDAASGKPDEFGNTPQVVIPDAAVEVQDATNERFEAPPPSSSSNAPVVETQPDEPPTDLGSIRDELQRRKDEDSNE